MRQPLALICLWLTFCTTLALNARIGIMVPLRAAPGAPIDTWAVRHAASALMAVHHINTMDLSLISNISNMLPADFQLECDLQDSMRLPSVAVDRAVQWGQQGIHTAIGSYRSAVTGPLALAASIYATPVISWAASASSLSDRDLYPTLSRTAGSDAVLAEKTIQSVNSLGWSRVGVVYVNDAWGRGVEKDISASASRVGVEVVLSASFALGDHAEMAVAVERIKKAGIYVILCPVFDSDLAALASIADQAGVLNKGYAWILVSSTNPADVVAASADPAATQRHLTGWFQSNLNLISGGRAQQFSKVLASEPLQHLNHSLLAGALAPGFFGGGECDQYCATLYDAVWTAAIAIGRTGVQADGSVDSKELLAAIREVSFVGASGRVGFDAIGERDVSRESLQLSNIQPVTGADGRTTLHFVPTWSWTQGVDGGGTLERLSASAPLWPGGEQGWGLPYEVLECEAGSVFSRESLRCEPCPRGTVKEGASCTRYDASIGILLPLRWAGRDGAMEPWVVRVAAAGLMAVRHINNQTATLVPAAGSLLPGKFKLVFDMRDSLALPNVGVAQAVEWHQQRRHAFVGSYRSAVTGPFALAASMESTPVIAWGATASSLSDPAWYPTLSRTVVSDALLADGTIRAFHALGWRQIAILNQDDTWGRGFASDAAKAALSVGMEVLVTATFEIGSDAGIAAAIAEVKASKARIILVLSADAKDIATLASIADGHGLLDAGYAWATSEEMISGDVVSNSPDPAATQRRLTGWLTTVVDPSFGEPGERFQRVLEQEQERGAGGSAEEANVFEGDATFEAAARAAVESEACSVFCSLIYDAVWTAAIAIGRTGVQADGSVDNEALLAAIREVSFEGASGRVQFDAHGERDAEFLPLILRNIRPAPGAGSDITLVPTWRFQKLRRSGGAALELTNISTTAPTWPGGSVAWLPPRDGTCAPGMLFSTESLECEMCPRGTLQQARECTPCAPGTIGAEAGMTACVKCQEGYASEAGMTACSQCPAFSARGPETLGVSADECFCQEEYFRFDVEAGFECRPCPEGVVCKGGATGAYPAVGWWGNGSRAFKCSKAGWCEGKNDCKEGHAGAGCGLCTGGRVMDLEGCVMCTQPDDSESKAHLRRFLHYLGVTILGALILIIWYYFSWQPLVSSGKDKGTDAKVMGGVLACCTLGLSQAMRTVLSRAKELQVLFKILSGFPAPSLLFALLCFLQVLGSLTNLSIDWPDVHVFVMRWANVLALGWSVLPGTTCVLGTVSFWHKLLAQTLAPAVLLFALGLPSIYVFLAGRHRHGGNHRAHPKWGVVSSRFIQSANIVIFLIYPSVSALVFSSFSCSDFGPDGRFLTADFRVTCDSAEYQRILWYSVAAVLVYPAGIPAYMLFMMTWHGVPRLAREKRRDARFQGLLVLRKRQLSTKVRARLAHRFGWTDDMEEFKRRVLGLGALAHAPSTRSADHLQDSTRNLEDGNLGWRKLHALIANFVDLPPDAVPQREVKAMMEKYDPNRDGMSTDEMALMIMDIVDQHCMFTDHEELEQLSMRQLQALRNHDWTLPADHHEDSLADPLLAEDEDDANWEDDEAGSKASDKAGEEPGSGRQAASLRRRESLRSEQAKRREELIAWMHGKAHDLERAGRLPTHPSVWREDGDAEERLAIQRLGFLFLSYRTDAWFFELVFLFYKLLMTSVFAVLFDGSSAAQISFAFITTLFMLVGVLRVRPIVNLKLANLQVLSLFVQTLNCFFGVMLTTGVLSGSPGEEAEGTSGRVNLMSIALVGLNVFVLFLPLVQVIISFKKMRLRYQTSVAKISRMNKADPTAAPELQERQTSSHGGVQADDPQRVSLDSPSRTETPSHARRMSVRQWRMQAERASSSPVAAEGERPKGVLMPLTPSRNSDSEGPGGPDLAQDGAGLESSRGANSVRWRGVRDASGAGGVGGAEGSGRDTSDVLGVQVDMQDCAREQARTSEEIHEENVHSREEPTVVLVDVGYSQAAGGSQRV